MQDDRRKSEQHCGVCQPKPKHEDDARKRRNPVRIFESTWDWLCVSVASSRCPRGGPWFAHLSARCLRTLNWCDSFFADLLRHTHARGAGGGPTHRTRDTQRLSRPRAPYSCIQKTARTLRPERPRSTHPSTQRSVRIPSAQAQPAAKSLDRAHLSLSQHEPLQTRAHTSPRGSRICGRSRSRSGSRSQLSQSPHSPGRPRQNSGPRSARRTPEPPTADPGARPGYWWAAPPAASWRQRPRASWRGAPPPCPDSPLCRRAPSLRSAPS